MSIIKSEDSKKWINAFVALTSIIVGYVLIAFLSQLGEWFDLESKIKFYMGISQAIGVIVGIAVFLFISKNPKSSTYLEEVYSELVKVVWPGKDAIVKMTFGIVIVLAVLSALFVLIDYLFSKLLSFVF